MREKWGMRDVFFWYKLGQRAWWDYFCWSQRQLWMLMLYCWRGRRAAHNVLFFHPLGSTSKANLRTQKGSQHRELCESSITFDGIEAENFILRKERKSWKKLFCTLFWTSMKECLVKWIETLANVLKQ